MDLLANSWLVLVKDWNGILGILCIFFLGAGIVFLWLKTLFKDDLAFSEYFVLSAGGALSPMFLGISLALLFDFVFGVKINFILYCLVIFIICCLAVYRSSVGSRSQALFSFFFPLRRGLVPALVLILVLIGSVYIRLAFISGLITPLYFDSATHYSIILGLITRFENSSFATSGSLVSGYYHLGFHVLIAAISLALHLDVKDAILIFGQIILAIVPLPLFFIVRQETKLDAPGIFATLLAGWGWSMPAHVLNWGKYPALTSLLAFEFVLCSLYLVLRSPKRYRWLLAGVSGLGILVSTFIHTRSFVLMIIAVSSGALALLWRRLSRFARGLVLCFEIAGIIALIFIIQSKPILSSAFVPYRAGGFWMIFLVLLLFPFALKEFPATTFSITSSFLFLLGSIFIPVTRLLPGYDAQTLLDRPFVEMSLSFPLAFLGGLGYAGLVRTLNNLNIFQEARKTWINVSITMFLFGAIFVNITQYNFYPSTCCQFFGDEDAVALDWMNRNIPLDATILISTSESSVLESPSSSYTGSDGGVWITPLIHRNSVLLASQADFSTQSALEAICKARITHIYVGGRDTSIHLTQLEKQPAWYEMLLLLPKAQVFKIIGCH